MARTEVLPGEIDRTASEAVRVRLAAALRSAGYRYVCLDLEGYRPGAMNEVLEDATERAIGEIT